MYYNIIVSYYNIIEGNGSLCPLENTPLNSICEHLEVSLGISYITVKTD